MDLAADSRPLISVHYYGIVIETLMFGLYLVLACISFWIMNQRRKEGNSVNKIISVCCVLIFFCATIHWGGTVALVYDGIVTHASRPDIGIPILYGSATKAAIIRLAVFGVGVLTMDVMLTYRLWVVWGRSWAIIAVPILNTILSLVSGIIIVVCSAVAPVAGTLSPLLRASLTASFCLHAITTIFCTGLIVMKIFRNSMSVSFSNNQFMPLVWIIVESAAIYTALSLCLMALLLSGQPISQLFSDIQPPMMGITSSLLIVRVAAGSISSGQYSQSSRSRRKGLFGARTGAIDSQFGDIPMKVSATRHQHVNQDEDMERKVELGLAGPNLATSSASSGNVVV